MKKINQKKIDSVLRKITGLTRHIRNVEDNCILLGTKLIERGEIDLGRKLIANGMIHDASKFGGIEFENLSETESCKEEDAKLKLKMAIHHHQTTNPHHAEYWSNGIEDMPDVYLAELVCDLKARSEEFGTALLDYIDDKGLKRWEIDKDHPVYKKILDYIGLLCPKPFENLAGS